MVLTGADTAPARPATTTHSPAAIYALLVLLGVALFAAAVALGHGDLSDAGLRPTLVRLRLLRTSGAFIAGAALAAAGVVVQALFRNPLADPSILGAGAGASLGGQVVLIVVALAGAAPWLDGAVAGLSAEVLLPVGCILGALGAMAILLMAARLRASFLVVLLTGFVMSSVFISIGALLISVALQSPELGRASLSFTLGSVGGVGLPRLLPAAALAGGAFVILCDLAARTIAPRGELPLGVVSGLVGAPLFLIMLRQGARRGRLG